MARLWIDLSNSPHVRLFEPLVNSFREKGWEVLLTARDHAQTLALARQQWNDVLTVGGPSPPGRAAKATTMVNRIHDLREWVQVTRPDVALSHGSYAQIVAARTTGVPAVTMMDYEHQPANHLSFRLAARVIVPEAFPAACLRTQGASPAKVVKYSGFKEELYLARFRPDASIINSLGLDRDRVIAVFRPPPAGALYHRSTNDRFDETLDEAINDAGTQVVLLARWYEQSERFQSDPRVCVPREAVDACSLMSFADVVIGGGGTMNREAALLGTPVYTVFAGRLAAVDAELIRLGLLRDLRDTETRPAFVKRPRGQERAGAAVTEHAAGISAAVLDAIETVIAERATRANGSLWPFAGVRATRPPR